jgi:hypothetical protein
MCASRPVGVNATLVWQCDLVAGFDDGIAKIVEHLALPLIQLYRGLDLVSASR